MTVTLARSDHEGLEVWQVSMRLMVEVYTLARDLPIHERFGMTAQLRRAALSIPANIAEGSARFSPRDRLHFLAIARGSLAEVTTLLAAALMLGYMDAVRVEKARDLANEAGRLLNGLRRYVAKKIESR